MSSAGPSRFGVLLNAEHPHSDLMDLARLADDLGFRTFWYADERFYRETYTGLAACALVTRRIRLGTAVTDPYTKHPALTAAAIASLDELSGGRAVLGLGAGISGFHVLGLEPRRPALRLREAIAIVRGLLAGEAVTLQGETVSIAGGRMLFPTRADLPVFVAADGPRTLKVAGEVADGVILAHCASLRMLRDRLDQLEFGIARRPAGRPELVLRLDVSLSVDRAAALHQAKVRLGRYLWARYPDIPYIAQHGLRLPAELDRRLAEAGPFVRTHDLAAFARFADVIPDDLVRPIALAGTVDEVAGQAQALLAAGVDEIMAMPLVPPGETQKSTLRLLAQVGSRL